MKDYDTTGLFQPELISDTKYSKMVYRDYTCKQFGYNLWLFTGNHNGSFQGDSMELRTYLDKLDN
jgi:hypothetical protein